MKASFLLRGALALLISCVVPHVAAADDEIGISRGDPAKGGTLFRQYCAGCHGKDGRGGAHTFMPHVDTLTKEGYIDLVPDDYLYTAIAEGGLAVGKSSYMPAWESKLSEEEIIDIIAHIRALPLH